MIPIYETNDYFWKPLYRIVLKNKKCHMIRINKFSQQDVYYPMRKRINPRVPVYPDDSLSLITLLYYQIYPHLHYNETQ